MSAQTGPKTPEGKRRVSQNALKHGILSTNPVLPKVESQEEWEEFRAGIFEALQPEGALECALADRAAGLLWRLRRTVTWERECTINAQSEIGATIAMIYKLQGKELPDPPDEDFKQLADRLLAATLMPPKHVINTVTRHETRLHRHLLQTLHQYALIKSFRKNLPHNSKHGLASLDAPPYNRNKPALPMGPSLTTKA